MKKDVLFEKEFTKNPQIIIDVTLEYVSNESYHSEGSGRHTDLKKGDKVKCSFTPPYTSIMFNKTDDGIGRKSSVPLNINMGAPMYRLVSIDKVIIKKED